MQYLVMDVDVPTPAMDRTESEAVLPSMTSTPRHASLAACFSSKQTMFRSLLNAVASKLTPENVESLIFIYTEQSGRDARERPSALEIFRSLEHRGVFSADRLEPLEAMLTDLKRNDIVNTDVSEFKRRIKDAIHRADSDPSLSIRGTSSLAATDFVDTSHSQLSLSSTRPQSMTTSEKKELFRKLSLDPDLQSEVQSLSSASHRPSSHERVAHQTSTVSSVSTSSGYGSSPNASLSRGCGHNLATLPEAKPLLHTQTSDDAIDFCTVGASSIGATPEPHPPNRHVVRNKMEWSICRMELGQRIVAHSTKAFIKGNFSLTAGGICKWRLNKPVSLVFKVYPFGLGNDENQSLTLEVVVVCRSSDLRPIARVSLEMTASMDGKLISTRSWTKSLKTFWIHDFLPHEIITHSHSKTLDLVMQAFITFN